MADFQLAHLPPNFTIYQGDTLPSFAAAIEDTTGSPIDLGTAEAAFLQLRHPDGTMDEHELTIVSGEAGIVTFDWTTEISAALAPGRHEVSVRAVFPSGELVAPGDRNAAITVRPALSDPT